QERARRGAGFFIDEGGSLRTPKDVSPDIAAALVSEWQADDNPAREGFLGPVRYGSHWIVATRVRRQDTDGSGWSVAYASLDELLAAAQLGKLVEAGYDFEVSQT